MNLLSRMSRLFPVLALVLSAWAMPSNAAVSVFFSAGNGCGGSSSASFTPGGSPVQVTLCMTTTAPTATCGHTVLLQSAVGESGKFSVVAPFTLGANYNDPNSSPTPTPLAISNPAAVADFGGTSSGSVAAAANQILGTFNLQPDSSATANSYVISLSPVSVVAVDADGTCGQTTVPTEQPISASFTLNKTLAPVFTNATSATFAVNAMNTFTFVAPGATNFSVTGTFPNGMSAASLNASSGVLSGVPTNSGAFSLMVTASNGSGMATQAFTLTVSGQASQTINFVNPGTQTFSAATVNLTATATSGLSVVLSSNTPNVCSVSGNALSMVSLGTCTIVASQSGNAQYLAATNVSQSFGIVGTIPGAPTIGAATAGNAQASVAFTAPSSNGGSQITTYTATCGGVSANGNSSPITVTGLTNSVTYACSVTATNALGTGPSSGSVMVTPSAAAMLTLVGVNSRKTHGAAGVFDLPIDTAAPLNGALTVEPRDVGAGHQIVFEFNNAITSVGGATTTDSAMMTGIGSPMVTFAGNEVTVTLTGAVLVNKRLTISLSGVNGAGTASVNVGFLMGDMDNTRSVTGGDVLLVKGKSGQSTNLSNFTFDIDASGAISAGDILLVKGRSGTSLAP